MQAMTNQEHATAMAALRAEALERGDPESLWIARLMGHALDSLGAARVQPAAPKAAATERRRRRRGEKEGVRMPSSYVLATTESVVRWYVFDTATASAWREGDSTVEHTLSEVLDLRGRVLAGNKETAKQWAKALGLATWRYVRL